MYKILLVDDEKLVLKSLQFGVEWERYGFEIAGTANSALEALEKIEQLSPEVVFTDIHMADISGLELLQMIRRKNPDIYCVVISGYAEFGYVQKAMELESVGYCLKPFDYDEIEKYLKRIRRKLDEDRTKQFPTGVLADYMIRRDEAAVAWMEQFYQENGIDFQRQELLAVCVMGAECTDVSGCALSVPIGLNKQVCLVERDKRETFFQKLEESAGKTKLHVGCSRTIEGNWQAPREIQEAYRCAYQFFCEGETLWLKEAPESWNDRKAVKEFQAEVQKGEEGIDRGFALLKKNFAEGGCSIDVAVMVRNMVEMMAEGENLENAFAWDYDSLITEYSDVEEMLDSLKEQCRIPRRAEKESAIMNRTFREIYRFVEENYRTPITASDLAERFHINNCYVSQLFKKEMGKTFTEYVTEKRIQYVCVQLVQGDQNINEIAEQAGFKDYFYFSRVFRRMKQCTPTEYRNRNRRPGE